MRRAYHKPFLVAESFQLDAAVAAGCTGEGYVALNHRDYQQCNVDNGFYYNYTYCEVDMTPPDDDGNDGNCYHGPTAGVTFLYS